MKLTLEKIQRINFFEKITGAKTKDCFEDDGEIVFLVEEGNVRKAVLKLEKLKNLLKRDIKIIGFSSDPVKFINNLLYPIKVKNIKVEENKAFIECSDSKMKGKVFGRDRRRLFKISSVLKRYHGIEGVTVK